MADGQDLTTTAAAAKSLGYTPQHVRRLVRQGILDGEKVGRDWLIREESLRRFVASRENTELQLSEQAEEKDELGPPRSDAANPSQPSV